MEVGSLVVCVENFPKDCPYPIIYPTKDCIYTIRQISEWDITTVLLEEIVNEKYFYREGIAEAEFDIRGFREIQPPMTIDIELIIEQPAEYA